MPHIATTSSKVVQHPSRWAPSSCRGPKPLRRRHPCWLLQAGGMREQSGPPSDLAMCRGRWRARSRKLGHACRLSQHAAISAWLAGARRSAGKLRTLDTHRGDASALGEGLSGCAQSMIQVRPTAGDEKPCARSHADLWQPSCGRPGEPAPAATAAGDEKPLPPPYS
jgi:hypothetical protein